MHLEDLMTYVTVYRHTVMYVSLVWLHNDMVCISLCVYMYLITGVKDSVQLNNSKNASRNEPIVIGVGETVSFTASSIYSKTTISYMYVSILRTYTCIHAYGNDVSRLKTSCTPVHNYKIYVCMYVYVCICSCCLTYVNHIRMCNPIYMYCTCVCIYY